MIILTKDKGVVIPDYNDLDNKPKINGVTLEGNLNTEELGITMPDLSNYYTKTQSDNRFQPKGNYQPAGNYLTSVPSEYVTETELNNTLNQKDYTTKTYVDNLIDNVEVDLTGYATEQWVENKGYLTAVPNEYVTETELNNTLTNKNYATVSQLNSKQDTLVSGTNIKTINGNSILGSGDLTTEDLGISFDITAIDASFNALDSSIEENYGYITSLNQAISDLDTLIDNNANQIGTLSNDLESLDSEVTSLDNDFKNFTEYVDSSVKIPTMFIPDAYSGSVDLEILLPIYDAVMNDTPWIVWGNLGAAYGRYNMIECSTMGDNSITFYDNSVFSVSGSSLMRYWKFNLTDGTFTLSERIFNFATTTYVDEQIGDINTILENIIG